jgi:double zinc ribbon protein
VIGVGLHDVFHSTAFAVARNVTVFVLVVFWLGLAYWALRDARRRIDDTWLVATAGLLALVPVFGPLAYLLFRPPETLADVRAREIEMRALKAHLRRPEPACPVCRSGIDQDYIVCPVCTTQLKQPCASCGRPLEALWQACPYCAAPVGSTPVGPTPVAVDLDTALTAEAVAIPQGRLARRRAAS